MCIITPHQTPPRTRVCSCYTYTWKDTHNTSLLHLNFWYSWCHFLTVLSFMLTHKHIHTHITCTLTHTHTHTHMHILTDIAHTHTHTHAHTCRYSTHTHIRHTLTRTKRPTRAQTSHPQSPHLNLWLGSNECCKCGSHCFCHWIVTDV